METKKLNDCDRSIFTLSQSIPYQIKIAGQLGENWSDWVDKMDIQIEAGESGHPSTTLTGAVDQAALIGLLRKLYYLGFPLISINCI